MSDNHLPRTMPLVRIPLINLSSHGGVRILVELANALEVEGNKVELLVPPGKRNSVYKLNPGVLVREIGVQTGIKHLDYAIFLAWMPFCLKRCTIIANFFVTYFPCLLGAWIGRSKILYFVQDIESKYSGPIGQILNFICNLTYRSKVIVAANPFLEKSLRDRGASSLEVINIGPTEPFFVNERLVKEKSFQLAYMVRGESWKRIDRFDEIVGQLAEIPRNQICCIGQDEGILAKYQASGFSTFKPANDSELIRLLDASEVFLLTSEKEGFGLPPLEAMARGMPVVAFRCGGPDLYIRNGCNSFLVESIDLAVKHIRELLENKDLHEKLSHAGMATAKDFRLANGLGKLTKIIRSLGDSSLQAKNEPFK